MYKIIKFLLEIIYKDDSIAPATGIPDRNISFLLFLLKL